MTPASRDRNLGRVRGLTAGVAGASLAACGLFAGLAASATKHVAAAVVTTTAKQQAQTAATTAAAASSSSSLSAPASTPVQTYSPPVATSGGS